jgi:hypothetical protein
MSFDRQLDILISVLVAFVIFVGCVLSGAMTVTGSLQIAVSVLLAGLLFGREVAQFVLNLLH